MALPPDLSGATTKAMGEESPAADFSGETTKAMGEESPATDVSGVMTMKLGEDGVKPPAADGTQMTTSYALGGEEGIAPSNLPPIAELTEATTKGIGEETSGKIRLEDLITPIKPESPEADGTQMTTSYAFGGEEGIGPSNLPPLAELTEATTKGMGEEGGKMPSFAPPPSAADILIKTDINILQQFIEAAIGNMNGYRIKGQDLNAGVDNEQNMQTKASFNPPPGVNR